ncbi:MAG: NAD(+) synthase [Deltaproteobacteria bacterium HGW-Deltaproteobacteria-10]|nr:MAG: NAD(+) synthase [Deltaproteobacteria bacterium HGW-Deltaproteobacteria-10]
MIPSLTPEQAQKEARRIEDFLIQHLNPTGKAVVGLSGGIDADVVARLTCRAIGPDRLKLFIVIQDNLEKKFILHARNTAISLGVPLVEIDLSNLSLPLLSAIAAADPSERFRTDGLLDPARIKSSLRTSVFSTYVERGYVVVGTSNRTEYELGFFLPLGDGVWHLGPIAHLYKSQVFAMARYLNCAKEVISQPPSGGFWIGETDLEDLSFWLVHGAPVREDRNWSPQDMVNFTRINSILTFSNIDSVLSQLSLQPDDQIIADIAGIPVDVVSRIRRLEQQASQVKKRPLRVSLE